MDSRTRSIVAVYSRCAEASRDKDFNRHYNGMNARLVGEGVAGLFSARRYELRPGVDRGHSPDGAARPWSDEDFARTQEGRYLALYETSLNDPEEAFAEMRLADEMATIETLDVVHQGFYRRETTLHPKGFEPNVPRETNGVLIAFLHPRDEARYERWYVSVHLADEAAHGVWHTVTRFRNTRVGDRGTSFSVLETDWKNIVEANENKERMFGPTFSYPEGIRASFERLLVGIYQRIS
jgi:hypothetical protein